MTIISVRPSRLWPALLLVLAACSSGADAPATTAASVAPMESSTTSSAAPEPSTTVPVDVEAWSESDAEKHVANFLEALAAGAYEQAAWPAENNGVMLAGAEGDETPAETLARWCAGGRCAGPYQVRANGPGRVDADTGQASSTVNVTHIGSGESTTVVLATFEGQLVIADPPPLVASPAAPTIVDLLFGPAPPAVVVVERFDAFEIWEDGQQRWVTNWHAETVWDVEADVIAAAGGAYGLARPDTWYGEVCSVLMMRGGDVVAAPCGGATPWDPVVLKTGEVLAAPIPSGEVGEGGFVWFDERGGVVISGVGDAEGNSRIVTTSEGVDLAGGDYVGFTVLSTDGSLFAYTDHDDPAAVSHFWSPVVVVKDTRTGAEVGRFTLGGVVVNLQLADGYLLAGVADVADAAVDGSQSAVVSINLASGEMRTAETATRVFLPVPGPRE